MKIGIFYASTTGNTERAANLINDALQGSADVALYNVASDGLDAMADCDVVILGTSTWNYGELQDDWASHDTLDGISLAGKKVAVFGLGDQGGFSDTYVNGMGILADAAVANGGELIGAWPTDGYNFSDSGAVRDGKFVGLALDEESQGDQTEDRIATWTSELKATLGL